MNLCYNILEVITMQNSNAPLKVRVGITIDEDVAAEIRKRSDEAFRSFSQYINLILRRHIERTSQKPTT